MVNPIKEKATLYWGENPKRKLFSLVFSNRALPFLLSRTFTPVSELPSASATWPVTRFCCRSLEEPIPAADSPGAANARIVQTIIA